MKPTTSRWSGLLILGAALATMAAIPQEERRNREETKAPALPARVEAGGIENLFRLGPGLYSGGDPRGADGLAALKKLGIKTIVSVDGSAPDVEAARKLGLRYVHLPIGYDGVPRGQAVKIIKAAGSLPGPVYVHCHHGKHRGPAAAGLCGLALEGWTREQALAWLKQAGTSPHYQGLYAANRELGLPSPRELEKAGTDFPERAQVPPLVETMVQVDQIWDRLQAVRAAGFKAPADHPDVDPPHEALQLAEQFRELSRRDETKRRGGEYVRLIEAFERQATDLETALRALARSRTAENHDQAEAAFRAAGRGCADCHSRHRDNSMQK